MTEYKTIKVQYTPEGRRFKLRKAENSDWIDLYTERNETIYVGEYKAISLGVAIELPKGYEAIVASRSSTFKHWGLLPVNGIGVIDNSFKGKNDIWHYLAFATKDVTIPAGTRLCQFRIIRNQPAFKIEETFDLTDENRGGIGSTGR